MNNSHINVYRVRMGYTMYRLGLIDEITLTTLTGSTVHAIPGGKWLIKPKIFPT